MSTPNAVELYSKWAESFTDAPPQFHRYTAYWILSTLLGRRVHLHLGDSWLFPNLWMVLLAPSSFYRKSTAISIGSGIVESVEKGLMLPSEWTQECLITLLKDQPHGAMIAYEFKSLLALLMKEYNFGAQSLLTELYDSPKEYVRKKGVDKVSEFVIEKPYLTILGASTVDWLIQSVKGNDIAGGFLARFLFVSAETKPKSLAFQPRADQQEKLRIIEAFRTAINVQGEMSYALDAQKYYEQWFERFVRKADDTPEAVRAFFPRLTSYCHKFAMLEAVLNGHFPVITLEDAKRAAMIADSFAAEIRRLGEEDLGKTRFQQSEAKVLKAVRNKPGIERSILLRNAHMPAKEFKEILSTLIESGLIKQEGSGFYPDAVEANGN